jgi:hypothetical protein
MEWEPAIIFEMAYVWCDCGRFVVVRPTKGRVNDSCDCGRAIVGTLRGFEDILRPRRWGGDNRIDTRDDRPGGPADTRGT